MPMTALSLNMLCDVVCFFSGFFFSHEVYRMYAESRGHSRQRDCTIHHLNRLAISYCLSTLNVLGECQLYIWTKQGGSVRRLEKTA
jgi:hypothetical protein